VWVKAGLEGKQLPAPSAPATLDQKGCRYEPHVVGVMVGQELLIRNSDDLLHNIHALPFENKEFNFGQPSKGMEEKKTFAKQEVMVKVKCDVHPWMSAWVGVVAHPCFAVTDATGKFEIKGVPPGKYTVEVWQEKYKSVTADVEVKAGAAATANFEMKDKRE
jgi:plastocyanin